MEKIKDFLKISSGSGSGSGSGYGSGSGSGSGYGSGSGSGSGYGYGSGSGDGYGSGYGSGDGSGSGSGSGSGYEFKTFCDHKVFLIDDIPTVLSKTYKDGVHCAAKGSILRGDLTLDPCYVYKYDGRFFAHGKTLREARNAAIAKSYKQMPAEERARAFVAMHDYDATYSNADFYSWHNKLTGSCEMGRKEFMRAHGLSMDGHMTVREFINLTRSSYGGDVIKLVAALYEEVRE